MSEEVNSIEELVAGGISELQTLADSGNTVAQYWLARIQQQPVTMMKLAEFGEMRVKLMMGQTELLDKAEAKQVYDAMWPKEV